MLYESKTFELLELLDIVGFIVGIFLLSIVMGPSGRITHVIGYIGLYCIYWNVWDMICRYCIWVELPVQRRLCPIF